MSVSFSAYVPSASSKTNDRSKSIRSSNTLDEKWNVIHTSHSHTTNTYVGFYSIFVGFFLFQNSFFKANSREEWEKNQRTTVAAGLMVKKTCHSMADENRGKRIAIRPPNQMYKCWVLIYLTENNNLHNAVRLSVVVCVRVARDVWMMAMMTIIICLHTHCSVFTYMRLTSRATWLDALARIRRKIEYECAFVCERRKIYPYLLQITSHCLWLIYWRALNTVFNFNYCGRSQRICINAVCVRVFACSCSAYSNLQIKSLIVFRCAIFSRLLLASMRSQRPTYW